MDTQTFRGQEQYVKGSAGIVVVVRSCYETR